jgi:hypothetical protein
MGPAPTDPAPPCPAPLDGSESNSSYSPTIAPLLIADPGPTRGRLSRVRAEQRRNRRVAPGPESGSVAARPHERRPRAGPAAPLPRPRRQMSDRDGPLMVTLTA